MGNVTNHRRKLDDAQIQQLITWRERGWSYASIATRLGVSNGAIHYQCLRHGAVSPHQRRCTVPLAPRQITASDGRIQRRFTVVEDQRLLALEATGRSYGQIAREMERPLTSVRIRLMTLALHEELPPSAGFGGPAAGDSKSDPPPRSRRAGGSRRRCDSSQAGDRA